MDGRPIRASKCAANGAKNTGSSSSASTRPNSAGNTNSSDGKIASHNVGWSLTVLSTMASIPSIPRVRGHPPGSAPSDPGSTRRLFQVEVASRCGHVTALISGPHALTDSLRLFPQNRDRPEQVAIPPYANRCGEEFDPT